MNFLPFKLTRDVVSYFLINGVHVLPLRPETFAVCRRIRNGFMIMMAQWCPVTNVAYISWHSCYSRGKTTENPQPGNWPDRDLNPGPWVRSNDVTPRPQRWSTRDVIMLNSNMVLIIFYRPQIWGEGVCMLDDIFQSNMKNKQINTEVAS